jgi:hypothetical protein
MDSKERVADALFRSRLGTEAADDHEPALVTLLSKSRCYYTVVIRC